MKLHLVTNAHDRRTVEYIFAGYACLALEMRHTFHFNTIYRSIDLPRCSITFSPNKNNSYRYWQKKLLFGLRTATTMFYTVDGTELHKHQDRI